MLFDEQIFLTPLEVSMNALPPIPPAGTGPIRAVFFDADGILQIIGTPWRRALAEAGGEEFATRLLAEEGPTLEAGSACCPSWRSWPGSWA